MGNIVTCSVEMNSIVIGHVPINAEKRAKWNGKRIKKN